MRSSRSAEVLRRTAQRLRLRAIGRSFFVAFLVLCGVYLATLVVVRSLGVATDVFLPTPSLTMGSGEWSFRLIGFEPIALCAIPAVAFIISLLCHRRPTDLDAAREVDRQGGTKDLFLNAALLQDSPGEFAPLVAQAAEQRAAAVEPQRVVPYQFKRRLGYAAAALLGLLLAAMHFPQFDPFGQVEAAEHLERQKKDLAKSRETTKRRRLDVQRQRETEKDVDEVDAAIENLKSALQKMKPQESQANFKKLALNQRILGQKWQKISAEKLKELLKQKPISQQFGGTNDEKLQKWMRELQQGSADGLQKEMSELQEQLKRLEKTRDPVEREKLKRELQKRLQDLKNFAKEDVNSKGLTAALERAMKQLAMAENRELSTDALKALSESLDLAKLELKEIAQSAKDLQELEEALQALQMAKALNAQEKLDGQACANCQSMAEFAELYEQLLAQMYGQGMGQRGFGEGGDAPEDDSVESDFKREQVKSAITAGKVLLTLKTKGVGEKGDAKTEYREAIREVRQGAGEAILTEQIPPGYHESIRNYFDSIKESPD